MMKKLIILIAGALLLASCGQESFRVGGHVKNAIGETLYLEYCGLVKTEIVDSVVLPEDGHFRFKAPRPEYPDLYRLRIDKAYLMLTVDSTEQISVEAQGATFQDPTIEGSPKSVHIEALRRSIRESKAAEHKAFAQQQILSDPCSMAAYYALFQQKGGLPVFDIYAKEDRPYFSAVATSFHTWMPEYNRSKVLYNQVLDVINGERRAQNAATMQAFIEESESAFLDIVLPDENGENQALSQYKGKLIVLDFASIQMEKYKGYLFEMKELYNAYHSRGVEFYEVYPDPNKLIWEDQVRALPWTTVRTEQGLYDPVYGTFNVQAIPTLFLYNRKGEVVGRFGDFESLKQTLDALL